MTTYFKIVLLCICSTLFALPGMYTYTQIISVRIFFRGKLVPGDKGGRAVYRSLFVK